MNTKYDIGEIIGLPFKVISIAITPNKIEYQIECQFESTNSNNRKFYIEEHDLESIIQPYKFLTSIDSEISENTVSEQDPSEAICNLANKIGIHELYSRVVELRGEPTIGNTTKSILMSCKPEYLNTGIVREDTDKTLHDRFYAEGWNECNDQWISSIENITSTDIQSCIVSTDRVVNAELAIDAVIEAIDEYDGDPSPARLDMISDAIYNTVPPVIEYRPRGSWINLNESSNHDDLLQCPFCNTINSRLKRSDNFCPSCGADMRGECCDN